MSKLNILFTHEAFEDYKYWQSTDKKSFKKINDLIKSIDRDGVFNGIGKPEKLKGSLSSFYSRRIDREHRLIYKAAKGQIQIISCRYHHK